MKITMPAEWENPRTILLAMPSEHTDWSNILDKARATYVDLILALCEGGEKVILLNNGIGLPEDLKKLVMNGEIQLIEGIPYNDTWTRDYGPITVTYGGQYRELDFGFNGWGLKFAADKDNLVNLHLYEKGICKSAIYTNCRDFILEGGSIESDGRGTIMTTSRCLCSPNRNGGKSKQEIEQILRVRLGAQKVLWVDHGFLAGDDTDSHIDTLARLAPNDTIIYVAPPDDHEDIHFLEFREMEEQLHSFRTPRGTPYNLIALPFPEPIYNDEGERLPATYANYLVTSKGLYIPIYGQPDKDAKAVEQIKMAFRIPTVHTVDCRTLIRQHGSLHCSTMQLYH